MLIIQKTAGRRGEGSHAWQQIADWIARHDRRIPIYHRICLSVWVWAIRQSLAD
jgi:hypothetical protein